MTKMHWYDYNNTISLLNIAKNRIFHLVYNFKIFKFSTILVFCQPACQTASQPAIRPGSTSAMAPDFHIRKVVTSSL